MSILLVGHPGEELALAVATRLTKAGDEVRAIVTDGADAATLEELGVHIARGDAANGDLVERAAQGTRTIVAFEPDADLLAAVVEGAGYARVERVVVCSTDALARSEAVAGAGSFVLLQVPRPRLLGKKLAPERVAEAIDAADDLAGEVRLELDLSEPAAWRELGLDP